MALRCSAASVAVNPASSMRYAATTVALRVRPALQWTYTDSLEEGGERGRGEVGISWIVMRTTNRDVKKEKEKKKDE